MAHEAMNQITAKNIPQPRPALSVVGRQRTIALDKYECFIGVSTNVADLKKFIGVQASQWQPALLIGERGLRQEQVARALHQASEHWAQPFFAVNAHGLNSDTLHGLLFGPRGMIESCQRGTIYVNALTNLPLLLQQRFAAFIEEQRWRGRSGKPASVRLIFASEWNPAEMKADNRLAYGLVELLRPSSFTLKPLRERSEDVPYLARHLAARISQRLNKGPHEITPTALKMLMEYSWEQNIDELEAVLESAIANIPPHQVDEALLPSRVRHATLRNIPADGINLPQLVDEFERGLIDTALEQSGGSQTKASRLLGLRVQTLNMKLKRYAERDAAQPKPSRKS
jgi:DNA-binding NtrC family response regulator